jgi:hypothetical protein
VPLKGLCERIEQIARMRVDPPLQVTCTPLSSGTDDGSGYVIVRVPASALAPHQVQGIYYGRGDKTKIRLSDAEVARLYRRREEWNQDARELLDRHVAADPFADAQAYPHVFFVARPVAGWPEMCRDLAGDAEWREQLRALVHGVGLDGPLRAVRTRMFPGQPADTFLRSVRDVHGPAMRCSRLGAAKAQDVEQGSVRGVHRLGLEQDSELGHGGRRRPVVPAVDQDPAGSGVVQRGDHPHGGGLAGAVRPEKPGHRPRGHGEAQAVDRQLVPLPLAEAVNFDHRYVLRRFRPVIPAPATLGGNGPASGAGWRARNSSTMANEAGPSHPGEVAGSQQHQVEVAENGGQRADADQQTGRPADRSTARKLSEKAGEIFTSKRLGPVRRRYLRGGWIRPDSRASNAIARDSCWLITAAILWQFRYPGSVIAGKLDRENSEIFRNCSPFAPVSAEGMRRTRKGQDRA